MLGKHSEQLPAKLQVRVLRVRGGGSSGGGGGGGGGGQAPSVPQSCSQLVGNCHAQVAELSGDYLRNNAQTSVGSPAECCDACKLAALVRRLAPISPFSVFIRVLQQVMPAVEPCFRTVRARSA